MGPGVRRDDGWRELPRAQLVIPAKVGIQYAGKPAFKSRGRGVLGRPVKPGDDSGG
jgi:hypothetical protein